MSNDFFAAMALVFVIAGLLPFWRPNLLRRTMGRIASQPDNTLRLMGLLSMLLGVVLLYVVRQL